MTQQEQTNALLFCFVKLSKRFFKRANQKQTTAVRNSLRLLINHRDFARLSDRDAKFYAQNQAKRIEKLMNIVIDAARVASKNAGRDFWYDDDYNELMRMRERVHGSLCFLAFGDVVRIR